MQLQPATSDLHLPLPLRQIAASFPEGASCGSQYSHNQARQWVALTATPFARRERPTSNLKQSADDIQPWPLYRSFQKAGPSRRISAPVPLIWPWLQR